MDKTLVDPQKIFLLHIKLGLMNQFVEALPKDGECLNYLNGFLIKSQAKKNGFVKSDIRKMIDDFKQIVTEFLANVKDPFIIANDDQQV